MNELIQMLTSKLGLDADQAKGGIGLVLGFLKDKLGGADFDKVKEAVPDADSAIDAAPEAGGLGGMLGSLADKVGMGDVGDLAQLAGGFDKLGIDKEKAGGPISTVTEFIQNKGGDIGAIVKKALSGD